MRTRLILSGTAVIIAGLLVWTTYLPASYGSSCLNMSDRILASAFLLLTLAILSRNND